MATDNFICLNCSEGFWVIVIDHLLDLSAWPQGCVISAVAPQHQVVSHHLIGIHWQCQWQLYVLIPRSQVTKFPFGHFIFIMISIDLCHFLALHLHAFWEHQGKTLEGGLGSDVQVGHQMSVVGDPRTDWLIPWHIWCCLPTYPSFMNITFPQLRLRTVRKKIAP